MNGSGFRILSLDGGGIRGAFEAGFLAEIERKTGRRIGEYFDLVVGTSTGGIIAIALALGESAERIEKFYSEKGPSVFQRDLSDPRPGLTVRALTRIASRRLQLPDLDADWVFRPKYLSKPLKTALTTFLRKKKIGDAKYRLAIPAVDLVKGQPVVFKTSHLPGLVRDSDFSAVDVAMATAAAPSYFPPVQIRPGSAYADGGLWANNPALVAFAEAICICQRCNRPDVDPEFRTDEIRMLSVGTGRAPFFVPPSGNAGILFWGAEFLDVTGSSQSQGVDFAMRYLLSDRYKRIDFHIPSNGRENWNLDSTHLTQQLIHMGHEKASEELRGIQERFLDTPAAHFTAF